MRLPPMSHQEAHAYALLAAAGAGAERDDAGDPPALRPADAIALKAMVDEHLARRPVSARFLPGPPAEEDKPAHTLEDAREVVRQRVIDSALYRANDSDLQDLTQALRNLDVLIDRMAHEAPAAPDPRLAYLAELSAAVENVVLAAQEGGLQRDHFAGRLEPVGQALEHLALIYGGVDL